jgi:hypothetical protein
MAPLISNSFRHDMPAHASSLPIEGATTHALLCLPTGEALMTTLSTSQLLMFEPRGRAAKR